MDLSVIFIPLITLFTAQITALDLGHFRIGTKKLIFVMILELIVQVSVSGYIFLFYDYDLYARWFFITMDLPAFLIFFYFSKRRDFRDLFTLLVTIFLNFAISVPSMFFSQFLNNRYVWYNLFRIIIFSILFYYIHEVVRKRYLLVQEEIEKGWGIFSILPFIGSFALYYKYLQYGKSGNFNNVFAECMVVILILAIVFFIFHYIFDQLHEKYLVQEQKRILSMQNKAQRDQLEQLKETTERTNRRWHDMRHHVQELIELLEKGDSDKTLLYLKELRGLDDISREDHCLHPAVNSILCLWTERASKAGIEVEIKTDIPEVLNIEPLELSALFSNAFENAYEGCLRLPEDIKRFINVEARYNGKRLTIGFMNSCIDDIQFTNHIPVSVKKSGGIGTRSMLYTIRRYRGTFYFDAKDGVFTARFVINNPL